MTDSSFSLYIIRILLNMGTIAFSLLICEKIDFNSFKERMSKCSDLWCVCVCVCVCVVCNQLHFGTFHKQVKQIHKQRIVVLLKCKISCQRKMRSFASLLCS
jgi:phosphatidylserine synthase